jgi:hypothetical protein
LKRVHFQDALILYDKLFLFSSARVSFSLILHATAISMQS